MRKDKLFLPIFLGVILIGALTFVIAEDRQPVPTLYGAGTNDNASNEDGIACTMDAKMCPDGSYVGRIGPRCEFAPCPNTCVCPSGYRADGNICNPKCYYSQPPCLAPSIACKEEENETEPPILGASCGTVTPGYQNECCERKGYEGWNQEEFKCITKEEQDELENESEDNDLVACPADAKLCPDGTYVSRVGPDCEFQKCAQQYNISKEMVCCKVYGYGTGMEEVNVKYIITGKKECTVPENFVGGDREIVNKSYCIEEIKERRQEIIENIKEIIQEKNKIRAYYVNSSECPDSCSCSGSTIKCEFENGTSEMTVYAGNSGNVIVQIKNLNMSTSVTLYKGENGRVYGVFRGNETKEIHLPDEVKERLQNYTHRKLYNESINLTDDGYYKIEGKKKARLFWLIPVREHMRAEVNAETGETVKIRNPWWGFMARDVREKNNSSEEQ
jgi:hypothetical protein